MYSFSFQAAELFCRKQFLAMELQQTQRHASSPQVFVEFRHESALHKSNAPHAFHPVLLCSCCFRLSRIDAILSCGALSEQSVSSSRRLSTSVLSLQPSSSDDFQCHCSVPSQKTRELELPPSEMGDM